MKEKQDKKNVIICRCQDISLDEVEAAIEAGVTHPEQLKRYLHIGMGSCQGRTCSTLVLRILANKTGKRMNERQSTSKRPPLVTMPMKEFLGAEDEK